MIVGVVVVVLNSMSIVVRNVEVAVGGRGGPPPPPPEVVVVDVVVHVVLYLGKWAGLAPARVAARRRGRRGRYMAGLVWLGLR